MGTLVYKDLSDIENFIKNKRKAIKNGVDFCKEKYGLDCDILIKTRNLTSEKISEILDTGITASDIGAIAGVNKYSSPIKIYLEKTTEILKDEETESMYFGKILNRIVALEFASRNEKLEVKKVNAILKSKETPMAICMVDRMLTDDKGNKGILEIRTTNEFMKKEWDEDKVPMQDMAKVQWKMFITNVEFAYIATLIGGNKYSEKYIKRDQELIDMLKEIALEFWDKLQNKIPPEIDGSQGSKDLLNKLYPKSNSKEIVLGDDAIDMIKNREELKREVKTLDEKIAIYDNKLKELLKDNEVGIAGDKKVIWKSYERTSIDSKSLKENEKDIYQKYLKVTNYKKFEIKG